VQVVPVRWIWAADGATSSRGPGIRLGLSSAREGWRWCRWSRLFEQIQTTKTSGQRCSLLYTSTAFYRLDSDHIPPIQESTKLQFERYQNQSRLSRTCAHPIIMHPISVSYTHQCIRSKPAHSHRLYPTPLNRSPTIVPSDAPQRQ
jgi:hypothetical protein